MVAAAVNFRQAEKNTPPVRLLFVTIFANVLIVMLQDFTTNPPTLRNSVFCQKAPKNAELDGLVQAQDPANVRSTLPLYSLIVDADHRAIGP